MTGLMLRPCCAAFFVIAADDLQKSVSISAGWKFLHLPVPFPGGLFIRIQALLTRD
ncbi:hypothetical protein LJR255_001093 [Pararhizobium sp. LjRoot255]|uniref:hypothetical protein n=1 Tax=Pararhizobium sp. LjRoot255 TaxID=3342298 RepID=UPI003ECE69ED